MTTPDRTATPSLRLRVVVGALGLLAVLLVLLGVTIDLLIGAQARRDLHDRVMASATRADALVAAGTAPTQLAAELNGGGIRALLVERDGQTYGDPAVSPYLSTGSIEPPPPPAPPPPPGGAPGQPKPRPPHEATATVMTHPLPGGGRIILVADTTSTTALLEQLRIIMVVSGIGVLIVAAAGLAFVVRAAMLPLDRLTAVAASITAGDRGRRLLPDRPATELGRAASAFDTMLDALESSEGRARSAADAAARAEAATRGFLADAAHELRTPIAGIQAGAELIASAATQRDDDPDSAQQRHRAELVLGEARQAGRLVGDMLDLSRIDAGLPLDLQECDLVGVAATERDRTALLAPSIQVSLTGVPSLRVSADPNRVAQILANVTDNARRHTPTGGTITIDVNPGPTGAAVTVTDSGPGVPEEQRLRIFERLVRLDEARARDRGGAGLGLPIARALARAHGGDLVCLPNCPGARFQLRLRG